MDMEVGNFENINENRANLEYRVLSRDILISFTL